MAVGAMLLPALVGFFQGAAAVQGRGLEVNTMVRFAGKWLDMIKSLLPIYAKEIDSCDYTDTASSVNLFWWGGPRRGPGQGDERRHGLARSAP
ncbi:hypothetical protein [Streptosporangium sp. H16]|uniref:imine reductase family protein n=1 Tax=Streptosporangium sp. H16 TaxID=3444184 RepID=UPI003F79F89D